MTNGMTTNGDDPKALVHAYLDGQLDPANAAEIERRIASDPVLAAECENVRALQGVIHTRLPRHFAPPDLRKRVEIAAGLPRSHPSPSWSMLAAAALAAAVLATIVTWFALRPNAPDATANMIVASHMRALMAPQPSDISSSDRHTVKPWFSGRVPQAPQVFDLTNEGFPLVGGRVDIVNHQPVPTLVYRHRQHVISLVAVPFAGGRYAPRQLILGYSLLTWTDGGIIYWAVSDLGIGDLESFAKIFRDAIKDG